MPGVDRPLRARFSTLKLRVRPQNGPKTCITHRECISYRGPTPKHRDDVSQFEINTNIFDGRTSTLRSYGDNGLQTLSGFFGANRLRAARVVGEPYTGGRGQITFLGHNFFAAGGRANFPVTRRAVILLHEAVHQFADMNDQVFGGTAALSQLILDACAPALEGDLGIVG